MYATPEDIIDRYKDKAHYIAGILEDGTLDKAPLERALEEASAEIDGSLRCFYKLPIKEIHPLLRKIAIDIAVDAIPRDGLEHADLFERRAKNARSLLQGIGKGEILIGLPQKSASTGGISISVENSDFRNEIEKM